MSARAADAAVMSGPGSCTDGQGDSVRPHVGTATLRPSQNWMALVTCQAVPPQCGDGKGPRPTCFRRETDAQIC